VVITIYKIMYSPRTPEGYVYKVFAEEAVKSVGTRKVKGLGARFGTPETKDYDGEFFVEATEFGIKNGDSRPMLMEHGYNKSYGVEIIGDAVFEKIADKGWEYEAVFRDTDLGNKAYSEVTAHPYKSSGGAAYNTVRRTLVKDAYQLDSFFLAEMTFTQFPNDMHNPPIARAKSDAILFAISEMRKEQNETIKNFLLEIQKSHNEKTELLRDVMKQLKDSFTNPNTDSGIVLDEEIIKRIEDFNAEPLSLLS
jgi:hypothetical protein